MEQKLDLEFLDFDSKLGSLRDAATNLQKAPAPGPALRAYIKALKTLNAELLGRLGDARKRSQRLNGLREPVACRAAAAQPQVERGSVRATSSRTVRRRGHRRIAAAAASRR